MKHSLSKIIRIFAVLVAALALAWLAGRYGWRVLGFRACGGSSIEQVAVTAGRVEITGACPGLPPRGCVGWLAKEENGTLYFGVRYDPVFGFFAPGRFTAIIPTQGELRQVYLRAGKKDYLLWSAEGENQL